MAGTFRGGEGFVIGPSPNPLPQGEGAIVPNVNVSALFTLSMRERAGVRENPYDTGTFLAR